MNPHWIGFVIFMAIVMVLIASVPVGQSLALNSTATSPIQTLMSYTEVWTELEWTTLVNPWTHLRYFADFFRVLVGGGTLYAIFPEGSPWMIVWWVCMGPIIGLLIFGMAMVFIAILQRVI